MATCEFEGCNTLTTKGRRHCKRHRHLSGGLTKEQIEARWPLLAKELPPRLFRQREG